MPGHKGRVITGNEASDLTEVYGADSLFEADGIIRQSEREAERLFGFPTLYSTEGSSLVIRAMVYLASLYAKERGQKVARILAARNAHRSFISAISLTDTEVDWLPVSDNYLSCSVTPELLRSSLLSGGYTAVYLTSPDYLGNMLDIEALSSVCMEFDIPLLVDNAHGAYLGFLERSQHPIDLGATMVSSSAHKTLSTLTGGAYLHISRSAPSFFIDNARTALSLFASTSPSYLILSSLDLTNLELAGDFKERLKKRTEEISEIKKRLCFGGYDVLPGEPMKITIATGSYGYRGTELAHLLRDFNIECEFADKDYLVLMPSVYNGSEDLDALLHALLSVERRDRILTKQPSFNEPKRAMTVRDAVFSLKETVSRETSLGRISASVSYSCPPAVAIVMPGEIIDEETVLAFEYYGIEEIEVIKSQKR